VTITSKPVQYKGEDLDPEKGPGLGCFRFQLIVLAIFVVLTPLSVAWQWPETISTILLFAVLILLLVTGQTIIFLLRLVAADRRGRRRPLGSATRTVGELEDAAIAPPERVPENVPEDAHEDAPEDVPERAPEDAPEAAWADAAAPVPNPLPTERDDPPPADEEAMRQ
jgi:hypothetical protein